MSTERIVVKYLCCQCEHDVRFDDPPYGLIVAECKLGCEDYDPHSPVECKEWKAICHG